MEERKEWFTLQETAEILRLKPMTGPEADEAILLLVFTESNKGISLTPSYYFDKPLKMNRYRTVIDKERVGFIKSGGRVRGLWPACVRTIKLEGKSMAFRTERGGFPWKRYQHVIHPASVFKSEMFLSLFENRDIARISGRARIRGLWPTFMRSVNREGQAVAIPWKWFRYAIYPAPYFRHPFKIRHVSVDFDFTGLLDLIMAGRCRRENGDICLDYSGGILSPNGGPDIGEIYLFDPGDPEYPRVRIVPQAIQIGDKTHFVDCVTIKETDLVISRKALTLYAEQEGKLNVLEHLATPPSKPAEPANPTAELVTFLAHPPVTPPTKRPEEIEIEFTEPFSPPDAESLNTSKREEETDAPSLEGIGLLRQGEQAARRRAYAEHQKKRGVDICFIVYELKKSGASASFLRRELDPEYKEGENKSDTSTKGGKFVAMCMEKLKLKL